MNKKVTLRENWRHVRFGDVVRHVKIDVDPETSGLERYIAGEHMGTDDLHIRSWGLIGDGYLGPAFHRKFIKGQVLYGSRRTYLRKVAFADFDGVCANTTFVLEPSDDRLLPELLPFIMQTDAFNEHSVKQSKGSVNPYINFRDIAWFEFALPPLDEQRRIAEILWAADKAIEANNLVLERLTTLKSAALESNLSNGSNQQAVSLGDVLLATQYGTSKRSEAKQDDSVPVLRIPNVLKDRLDLSDLSWVILTLNEQKRYAVHDGDILLVRTNGNPAYVGRSVVVSDVPRGTVFASYLIRLRVNESRIRPDYLNILLNSEYLRRTLRHEIRSSAGNYNINTKGILRQRIPLPSTSEQDRITQEIKGVDESITKCEQHIAQSQSVNVFLMKQLLYEELQEA